MDRGAATVVEVDTLRRFETPEGIEIELRLAGPVPRAGAFAIDLLIRFGLYLVLLPLAGLAGVGVGLILLALFLLEWFYPVFFELRSGATPGKRAVGLVVVHADGTPVGPSASLLRNLLRALDFLPGALHRRAGRDADGPGFSTPRRPRRRHAGDLP
jgi:uncharacterized RDD family membrane protein YckC